MNKRQRVTITLRKDILSRVDGMIDEKIARNRSHAIEKVLFGHFGESSVRKAVILGGGAGIAVRGGEKVSPLAVKIGGATQVERLIGWLKGFGVEEVILSVGNFGDEVRAIVGDGARLGIKVIYFERDRGTAAALRQAKSILKDTFVMLNGHINPESVNLMDMVAFHRRGKWMGTMALTTVGDAYKFGQVMMQGANITGFTEKSEKGKEISHIINAGVYMLEPSVCVRVRPDAESLERDIFPTLAKEGDLAGYVFSGKWSRI